MKRQRVQKGVDLCSACLILSCCVITAQGSCVTGSDVLNRGASCNFNNATSLLCQWTIPADGPTEAWRSNYNNINLSPCISVHTQNLTMNQIARLRSPLLCATNNTQRFTYQLSFSYNIYFSDRCQFTVSLWSESDQRLSTVWNTQAITDEPRNQGWKDYSVNITNKDSPFYIVFAVERIDATSTTSLLLDNVYYSINEIPTTTTTTTSTTTTTPPPTTTTTTPTTTTPTTTTTTPTTTTTTPTTTTPTTTTPTTTSTTTTTPTTTTTTTTTTTPTTTTTTKPTTTTTKVATAGDNTLIWGLSRDVIIAIGAGGGVVLILVIIIICVCCIRAKRNKSNVESTSFALSSPTAYNVNDKSGKKSTKRRPVKKSRANILTPSKLQGYEPEVVLY